MARRRNLTGTPLLLATAGVVLSVGCGGNPNPPIRTGNLMPPPEATARYCVDATPDTSKVVINSAVATERCTELTTYIGDRVAIEVTADGFLPQIQSYDHQDGERVWAVTLLPVGPPMPRPVGNLMAPPSRPELVDPKPQ